MTQSGKQRVLIVDDETRNQRIITEVLEDMVEHRLALTGEEALSALEVFRPDLVLLDIMMPGMDGYDVCRRIRAMPQMAFTKVILVSGKAMLEERLRGYEAGADDYMTKPFMPEELLAKVKVFLRLALVEEQLDAMNRSLEQKVEERSRQLLDAEARMVNSAKMAALGEMAGGIAHEINTPLSTIALVADQLRGMVMLPTVDKAQVEKMSRVIIDTTDRIATIVRGLRTFSRDGSQDRFDVVAVSRIIADTMSLCREKVKSSGIEFRVAEVPGTVKISCRPVQISQILVNLVSNACDAISRLAEKWISIEVADRGDAVEIIVTDSGKGIPAEVASKMFHPFFTTKDVGKGTGLGLSVSKGIVDAHHGTIAVDASCPNTRFVIRLPVSQPERKAA